MSLMKSYLHTFLKIKTEIAGYFELLFNKQTKKLKLLILEFWKNILEKN